VKDVRWMRDRHGVARSKGALCGGRAAPMEVERHGTRDIDAEHPARMEADDTTMAYRVSHVVATKACGLPSAQTLPFCHFSDYKQTNAGIHHGLWRY
jgi:hypothetical protein